MAAGSRRSPPPSSGKGDSASDELVIAPPAPKRKRLFTRELKYMMHGFGDDPTPYSETVDLVEDLVIEFILEMTLKTMEVSKKGRVHVEDIIFLIRKDPKKYARVKDLLMMNEELKKARKDFSEFES